MQTARGFSVSYSGGLTTLVRSIQTYLRAFAASIILTTTFAGCPTVDLGDQPADVGQCRPDKTYFVDVLWPKFIAPADVNRSCVGKSGCHAATTGRSALRLTVNPVNYDTNYQVITRFLNCQSPSNSPLLTKPLAGMDAHLGGDIFLSTSDPAVADFEGWFP